MEDVEGWRVVAYTLDDAGIVSALGEIDLAVRVAELGHGSTMSVCHLGRREAAPFFERHVRRSDKDRDLAVLADNLGRRIRLGHFAQDARAEVDLLVHFVVCDFGYGISWIC